MFAGIRTEAPTLRKARRVGQPPSRRLQSHDGKVAQSPWERCDSESFMDAYGRSRKRHTMRRTWEMIQTNGSRMTDATIMPMPFLSSL